MVDLLIAIAAWCGTPTETWTRLEVDTCRETLVDCVSKKGIAEKEQAQCFQKVKCFNDAH